MPGHCIPSGNLFYLSYLLPTVLVQGSFPQHFLHERLPKAQSEMRIFSLESENFSISLREEYAEIIGTYMPEKRTIHV